MLPTAALAMTALTGGFGSPHWTHLQAWCLPGPGLSPTPPVVLLPKRVLAVCGGDGGHVSVTLFFDDPLRKCDPCCPNRPSTGRRVWLELFAPKLPSRSACPAEGARTLERVFAGY